MASLELRLLGGFEARLKSGAAINLRTRKGELLIAYLALSPGKAFSRDKLCALLWSDRSDDQARHSLRQTLSTIRSELEGTSPPPFFADGDRIGLNADAVDVDAVAFENLLASGNPGDLLQACNLYRGELLDDVSARDEAFEEWLVGERQRLHGLALRAFERALTHQEQTRASEQIADTAQRLHKLEPAHEQAHRALMRLYADQRHRDAVLRQYQDCRAALKRELNTEPSPETEQLFRELVNRLDAAPKQAPRPQVETEAPQTLSDAPVPQVDMREVASEQPDSVMPKLPHHAIPLPQGPPAYTPPASAASARAPLRRMALVAGILLMLVAALAGVWRHYHPREPVAFSPLGTTKLELPDRPSIAVLPFDNLSGDPAQSYIGHGIADDIITKLSHLRGMLVIARNSSFSFKNGPVDVRTVGEKLGVRHILEGSVQKSGDQLRITAQLVNADTREHVWAESYNRPATDVLGVQDEIVDEIVEALDVQLVDGAQALAWRRSTTNPRAYDLFLRARERALLFRREDIYQSIDLIDQALKLDPHFAMAWVWQGWNYEFLAWAESSESASKSYEKAMAHAEQALAIDPNLDYPHTLLGEILINKGDYQAGIRELEIADELNPNSAKNHALLALYLSYGGRSQEALEHIQKAWRLNPFPEEWYLDALGAAYHSAGRYDEAIAAWKECRHRLPDYIWCPVALTFTYMKTDRQSEARELVKEILRINPHSSTRDWATVYTESDISLLQEAGLPE